MEPILGIFFQICVAAQNMRAITILFLDDLTTALDQLYNGPNDYRNWLSRWLRNIFLTEQHWILCQQVDVAKV